MKLKASGSSAVRRVVLENRALALSANCPLDQTNPITCPLHELRRLPMHTRRAWVRGLNLADLNYLVLYHETCAMERQRLAGTRRLKVAKVKV